VKLRLGRAVPAAAAPSRPALGIDFAYVAEQTQRRLYSQGLKDGVEMTLRLLLGEEDHGGQPFTGSRSPELETWARDALRRVESA
jgi:hypothetical protein